MRTFNKREITLIRTIHSVAKEQKVSLQKLLEKIFFIENEGRALITQTKDRYSVFYLKQAIFNDETQKNEQIERFLELLSLFKYLKSEGYIHFFPEDYKNGTTMFFVQDEFDSPEPNPGKIILNSEGDYTLNPESILDKDDKVKYNGINLDNDIDIFLAENINAIVYVSNKFEELLGTMKSNKNGIMNGSNKWLQLVFNFLILLVIGAMTYLFWNKLQNYEPNFTYLRSSNSMIANKIDSVELKLKLLDSLVKVRNSSIDHHIEEEKPKIYYGIDISHYNGSIVEEIQLSDTISFVICKATEGLHFRDSYFDSNWRSLKEKGIIRGAYHFYHTNMNPVRQAKHFISVVGKWEEKDIAPVVDIEGQSLPKNRRKVNKDKLQKDLLKFLDYVEKETNRVPMIYVSKNFANTYLTRKIFAKYPLWLAEYTNRKTPILPRTWKDEGFKIWQKSDNYHFKSSIEDLDIYYGDLEDIYK